MWYLKENIDIGDADINRNIIQGSKIQIIKPYGVKFKDLQTLGIQFAVLPTLIYQDKGKKHNSLPQVVS